jgi:hypothetical protein
MQDDELNKLIVKYLNGTATTSEAKRVDDWYASFEDYQGLTSQLKKGELEKKMTEKFNSVLYSLKLKSQ